MTRQPPATEREGELSPAMAALTPLRRAFVVAKVYGGLNNTAAYRAASPNVTWKVANSHGWLLAHDERVQAAILEEGRRLMRSEGPKSIMTLVAIRDDKIAKPEVRVKAAVELLNRSGFHAVSEHHEHQHHHLSDAEQDRRILALCAELGMLPDEAKKMLIAPAEFEKNAAGVFELAPDPRVKPEPSLNAIAIRESRARRNGKSPEEWEAHKAQRRDDMRRERAEHEARRAAELSGDDAIPLEDATPPDIETLL